MKEIVTKVFEFDELDDAAKDKAREWYREGAIDHDWWENTFEDASRIGLRITSFDLGRGENITGEFKYFDQARQCASLIMSEHGLNCRTFKTAESFLSAMKALDEEIAKADGDNEESPDYEVWQDKRGELEEEFLRSLLRDYLHILRDEMEFLMSDEQVDESIRINEYTFTETGKRFG